MRTFFALSLILVSLFTRASEVEVLHWWTSDGEKAAVAVLKRQVEAAGIKWKDFAVQGGGGETAMTVLQARAIAGNPPTMAQIEGPAINAWARLGFLSHLDQQASAENWAQRLPDIALKYNLYQNKFVGVPLTIHRVNWLWLNKAIFDQLKLSPPTNWDEFFTAAETIRDAGYAPLALGKEPWQVALLFEMLVLGSTDADFYRRLMVQLDTSAISSARTRQLLADFRRLSSLSQPQKNAALWHQATLRMAEGKAGMQLLGDWVKGELSFHGYQPDKDYLCVAAPGTQGAFIYNMDSLVLFNQPNSLPEIKAQLASMLMEPAFQSRFNQLKGSLPARQDVSMDGFDSCSLKAYDDFKHAARNNTLVPSTADSMALPAAIQEEFTQILYRYFYQPDISASQVMIQLRNLANRKQHQPY